MSNPLQQVISNFDDSKRVLAKLMARENVIVQVVDGLGTASFNTMTRVLSIPNWTALSQAQFDFLIGHEVGHALFTDVSFVKKLKGTLPKAPPGLMSYFNVVEDARIERKMKNVYPGLGKDFYEAYRAFTQHGPLFKLAHGGTHIVGGDGEEYDIASASLIDRINLFFKIGAFVSVPIAPSEHTWIHRIRACPDMDTAIEIAKELHEHAKEEERERVRSQSEEGEPGEGEPGDGEGKGKRRVRLKPGDDGELDPMARTDKDLMDALRKLAEQASDGNDMRHLIYPVLTEDSIKGRIVPASEWTESVYAELRKAGSSSKHDVCLDQLEAEWNSRFMTTAKAMASEFERRKTAKNYHRATVSRTGRLDMSRLTQYKFTDDLFRRVTMIPDGQSHGFVMVIDASGSMEHVFPDVLDQAMLFAVFCYYAKIPCELYLFSDIKGGSKPAPQLLTLTLANAGQLVGMVNTVTDRGSFRNQLRACLAFKAHFKRDRAVTDSTFYSAVSNLPYSHLSGTPLYTGIMLGEFAVGRLKRTRRLDKMVFAVVSDGGDTAGVYFDDNVGDADGNVTTITKNIKQCGGGVVLRDERTKRNHIHVAGGSTPRMTVNGTLTMLLDVIRHRHEARTAYFFLSGGTDTVGYAINEHRRECDRVPSASEANRDIKEHGQYVFPEGTGVADLTMILPTSSMVLKDDATSANSRPTGGSVVDEYIHDVKDRHNSRKFINAVMPFVA